MCVSITAKIEITIGDSKTAKEQDVSFRNNTHIGRWLRRNSYDPKWSERSKLLLDLFVSAELEDHKSYRISEFGCGANAPFHSICRNDARFTVDKFDITSWDEMTRVCDLNNRDFAFSESDIGAFSGVLEYLNDVPDVLSRAIKAHQYLLVSYAFLPVSAKSSDSRYIEGVRRRSVQHGWRNHYSTEDMTRILSEIGVISNVGMWDRSQSLFLIRRF